MRNKIFNSFGFKRKNIKDKTLLNPNDHIFSPNCPSGFSQSCQATISLQTNQIRKSGSILSPLPSHCLLFLILPPVSGLPSQSPGLRLLFPGLPFHFLRTILVQVLRCLPGKLLQFASLPPICF